MQMYGSHSLYPILYKSATLTLVHAQKCIILPTTVLYSIISI